jgi:hypothetical protein
MEILQGSLTSEDTSQGYNFAFGSVWVRNLVFDIKGGTWTKGV